MTPSEIKEAEEGGVEHAEVPWGAAEEGNGTPQEGEGLRPQVGEVPLKAAVQYGRGRQHVWRRLRRAHDDIGVSYGV